MNKLRGIPPYSSLNPKRARNLFLFGMLIINIAFCFPALAISPPARVDDDHDGIDDNLEQKLAERFAPIVLIEPDESNYPVNVEWFLARASLQYHEDCFSDIDQPVGPSPIMTQDLLLGPPGSLWSGGPNCGEDDTGYSHPPHHLLTSISADPDGQFSLGALTTGFSDQQSFVIPDLDDSVHVGSTDPTQWRTYFHCYPTAEGGVIIQYWHLFAYDELAVGNVGNHGGDWDASIQVQLNPDLTLKGVWFSRHSNDHPGTFLAKSNAHLHLDPSGTHTVMSIDGGGHAAFADVQDYCDNAAPVVSTTIVYPTDPNDPANPSKLDTATSSVTGCGVNLQLPGGITWETWTGGMVRASGQLTHAITAPSAHGGLVNLGEYNPCTPTTCAGSAQASTLLAGEFHPLNGQIFIRYSGRWGSLPSFISSGIGVGLAPRGPVFQGFDDEGENFTNVYRSWYNQGAAVPAAPGSSPWLTPPVTSLNFGNPAYHTVGGAIFVTSATQFVLNATESVPAAQFGSPSIWYRAFSVPGSPGPFLLFSGSFSLSGSDGTYSINYFSSDALQNSEASHAQNVSLDNTAPTVNVNVPLAGAKYTHNQSITLAYAVSDGAGSGVQQFIPKLDGATTVAGHGLASGQAINLLTQMTAGTHTFTIAALDNLGNSRLVSASFTIIVTPQSIIDDVAQFYAAGSLKNSGQANSLTVKLNAAAAAQAKGNCKEAANNYNAFINELQAQRGKGVDAAAADIMMADAQYMIAHCP